MPAIPETPFESTDALAGVTSAPRPAKRSRVRLMKLVRRMHLYTGLVLLPWVIFFGFSGMLFNHPEFGAVDVMARISPDENEALGGFETLDAESLANRVVDAINEGQGDPRFRRAAGEKAVIEGAFVFQGPAAGGQVTLSIDPVEGDAVVTQTRESAKPDSPGFLETTVPTSMNLEKDALQGLATGLIAASGVEATGPIELAARGGAELRFRLDSIETGERWNVSWNPLGGRLSAREIGVGGGPDLYTVLTRFHKTHHYPERMGARWLWSAFGDATGLTMVFWGLSGAIMWWQIKPTRFLGVAGLSVAGVLAFYIFAGTYSNLHWVPREARPPSAAPVKPTPKSEAESVTARPAAAPTP